MKKAISISLLLAALASCNSGQPAGSTITDSTATANSVTTGVMASDTMTKNAPEAVSTRPARVYKNIIILPTLDASPTEDDTEPEPYEYTDSDLVPATSAWRGKVVTYGVGNRHLVAPAGWTGNGTVATNGGVGASLYPMGGSETAGAHISYYSEVSCVGCMLGHAAEFFKDAREDFGDQYDPNDKNHVTNKPGVKLKKVTSKIVTYSLPVADGMVMKGVVYYGAESPDEDKSYREVKIVLPTSEQAMLDYLASWYIQRWKP